MNSAADTNSKTGRRRCAVGVGAVLLLAALILARILNDSIDWVRINVVLAMERARLGGPQLAAALRPALTNSDGTIRRAGQSTLDRIEITDAEPPRHHAP